MQHGKLGQRYNFICRCAKKNVYICRTEYYVVILQIMRDFTYASYRRLLGALRAAGYAVVGFDDYFAGDVAADRVVLLRHDVDRRPRMALEMAMVECGCGVRSTYFFRSRHAVVARDVIRSVSGLGMGIGYHYEEVCDAGGDLHRAAGLFAERLGQLREVADVRLLSMHGSPLCRYDNDALWQVVDYRDYGIVGEVCRDVDFSSFFYLTDTGRSWDGVSFRDAAPFADEWRERGFVYRQTAEVVDAIERGVFPERVVLSVHPERWTDDATLWAWYGSLQWVKNVVKRSVKRLMFSE